MFWISSHKDKTRTTEQDVGVRWQILQITRRRINPDMLQLTLSVLAFAVVGSQRSGLNVLYIVVDDLRPEFGFAGQHVR